MRAAAVIIGNEVLCGKVTDENTPFLVRELRAMGVALVRVEIVPDELDVIADAVARASALADFVVTSGGVGPTHDDITMAAVAAAFGDELSPHPQLTALIEDLAQHRSDVHLEGLLRMARVPSTSQLHPIDGLTWPLVQVRNVFVLPGIPKLFQLKFATIRERYQGTPVFCQSVYVTLTESQLVDRFDALLRAHPDVSVGSYPRTSATAWSVRITLEHRGAGLVRAATETLVQSLPPDSILDVQVDS